MNEIYLSRPKDETQQNEEKKFFDNILYDPFEEKKAFDPNMRSNWYTPTVERLIEEGYVRLRTNSEGRRGYFKLIDCTMVKLALSLARQRQHESNVEYEKRERVDLMLAEIKKYSGDAVNFDGLTNEQVYLIYFSAVIEFEKLTAQLAKMVNAARKTK